MSDRHELERPDPPRASADHQQSEHVGSLLRLAGPRQSVPADRMQRVRTVVYDQWRQHARARSRRVMLGRVAAGLGMAALVVMGVRLSVRDNTASPGPHHELATIEWVSGAVRVLSSVARGAEPTWLRTGDRLLAEDAVDTTSGGMAALRLGSGASVRVAHRSRVRLISEGTLVLDQGALYVDAGVGRAHPIAIRTALGAVRDVGTRFEVRIDRSALRVRVRDGLVRVSQTRETHDAGPGDQLTLHGDGTVDRRAIAIHGPDWAWAAAAARPFDLEGRLLREFLDWIAAENGWQLRFASPAVEQKSRETTLHGSVEGLTPDEALSAILPASGVVHRLANGVLMIAPAATADMKN